MSATVPTVSALETCLKHIRAAGGVPNSGFYAALRAARALDKACSEPLPPVEGSTYRVTLSNGRDEEVFVPKGSDIFKMVKIGGLEMVSFVLVVGRKLPNQNLNLIV